LKSLFHQNENPVANKRKKLINSIKHTKESIYMQHDDDETRDDINNIDKLDGCTVWNAHNTVLQYSAN